MPDTPEITTARESGDPLDWALAWQATVEADPTILTRGDLAGWMTGWFANAGQSMINRYVDAHSAPRVTEEKRNTFFDSAATPEEVVFQAIGAGSMAWEHHDRGGIFDDQYANTVGVAACRRLEALGVQTVPADGTSMIKQEADQ